MKRNMIRLAVATFLLAGFCAPSAHAGGFLMWRAEKDGKTLHIVANIHFVTPDMAKSLAQEVQEAYEKSDLVVFKSEMDQEKLKADRRKAFEMAAYPPGDDLLRHVPEATAERFKAVAAQYALNDRTLVRLRPWMAADMIQRTTATKSGARNAESLESNFHWRAGNEGKPAEHLTNGEMILQQYGKLAQAEQIQLLDKALVEATTLADRLRKIEDLWRNSDADGAAALVDESFRGYEATQSGIRKSMSAAYADKLVSFTEYDDHIMVLLTLEDLVGRGGALEALGAKGFNVMQVVPQ